MRDRGTLQDKGWVMSAIDLEAIISDTQDGKKQELRLWLRLLSTTKLISQEIRRRLRREFGATLPQFDLLSQLYRETDGLRLGELSKRTMVTNGNITGWWSGWKQMASSSANASPTTAASSSPTSPTRAAPPSTPWQSP